MTSPLPRAVSALLTFAASTAVLLAQDECWQPKEFQSSQLRVIPAGNVTVVFSNDPASPFNLVPGTAIPFTPGTSTLTFVRPYASLGDTHWGIEIDADTGTTTDDNFMIVDGAVFLREGDPAPWAPAGETVGSFDDDFGLNLFGDVLITNNTNGTALTTADDYVALYTAGTNSWSIVAQEGQLVDPLIPGLAGATWDDTLDGARLSDLGDVVFRATGLDGNPPITSTTVDGVVVNPGIAGGYTQEGTSIPTGQAGGATDTWQLFDFADTFLSPDGLVTLMQGDTTALAGDDILTVNNAIVLQETQLIPGGPSAEVIGTSGIVQAWVDVGGNWYARGDYDPSGQDWLVRNGIVVATSDAGDPIVPGSTETWSDTDFAACFFAHDGNSSGAFLIAGVTDADSASNGVIVVDDGSGNRFVAVRENDPIDLDGNGAYDDDAFLNTFGNDDVLLMENGDVLFTATVRNLAGTTVSTGLFRATPGKASCVIRNGSGLNALGFECTTAPVLGGNWQLTTSPNPNTILTLMVIGVAPFGPVPFLGGEVLIDPTGATTYSGGGLYNLAVPNVPFYQGVPLFLQAVRFDNVGGGQTVIMNAIDAVLGN